MKPRAILNVFLLLAFVGSLALVWSLRPAPARPNLEYFPNMAHSVRYAAFSPNPNFPDGKTLQRPEPGTVPHGLLPLHFEATPQDALRAGEELRNPFSAADPRAAERGAFVFTNFCMECHGAGGVGNGPVALKGFPPPASLVAEKATKMKDGQIFHILTYGQGNMPSYASQLSREDRWKAILFVRSLQRQALAEAQKQAAAAAATSSAKSTATAGERP